MTAVEELSPYDSDAAHPEIYANAEYGMTATCETHDPDPETGNPQRATITFNLGSYTGPIILNLSIWHNQRYVAYETRGIALPDAGARGAEGQGAGGDGSGADALPPRRPAQRAGGEFGAGVCGLP